MTHPSGPGGGAPDPSGADPVAALERRVAELADEVAALREQRDSAWVQLGELRGSPSWRLTAPLRTDALARLVHLLRRGARTLRRLARTRGR